MLIGMRIVFMDPRLPAPAYGDVLIVSGQPLCRCPEPAIFSQGGVNCGLSFWKHSNIDMYADCKPAVEWAFAPRGS
jgi:hypothetical protein